MALFGYDSFISTRLTHQETFIRDYDSWPKAEGDSGPWVDYAMACVDQKPLSSLLMGTDDASDYDCISDSIQTPKLLDREIAKYVQSFYLFGNYGLQWQDPDRSRNAFAAAVYLANEAWLTSDILRANRKVSSDPGADMVIPAISRAGMIVISALWAVYIACLFSLAVYSAITPRWTLQLDSFAMLRIGAAAHEEIKFDVGFETKAIDALDKLPGSIGDSTGGEGDIGALGLGASSPLRAARRYKCYSGEEENNERRVRKYQSQRYG
jgi:hypothetical protein